MSIFNLFKKNKGTSAQTTEIGFNEDSEEDYIVPRFFPNKIYMTEMLIRKQKIEEIRKKYCTHTDKSGEIVTLKKEL